MPRALYLLLGVAATLSILNCRCHRAREAARPTAKPPEPAATPLSKRFTAEQGFAFILPQLKPVHGVGGVRASDCAVCHRAIHREWQGSTHAWALRDIQYQAELFKPSSPRWLCLNCHIPVQNQRRHLVTGLHDNDVMRPALAPNPGFDARMQQEAITCATCHVRPDARGRSRVIGPRGNPEAPHPVKADRAALRKICLRCHDPRGERITPLLVCWFTTRAELEQGPYGEGMDCVDCHMPKLEQKRRLAAAFEAYPERETRAHHFDGGGVPKSFGGYAHLLRRGHEPGVDVKLVQWTRDGAAVGLELQVENARAGHNVTTADPERHLLLVAELRDGGGKRLQRATERIGQTWKWSPRAVKIGDNRLAPEEQRSWKPKLSAPAGSKGLEGLRGLKLVVTAYHVRLTSKNAHHIKQTRVEETYIQGIAAQVRQLERHYPMASLLFREEVDLDTGKRRRASRAELVQLSRKERDIPLDARDY